MTATTVTIPILQDYWWIICILAGAVFFIFKSGYKSRKVVQRLECLEIHDEIQRKDIEVLVIANFAILDGLKQQGCNGKVTKAHEGLQEHITKNRYTIE